MTNLFFVNGHVEAGNRLKHWSGKKGTMQGAGRAGTNASPMDTDETEIAVQGADHYVRSFKVTTTIDPSFHGIRKGKRY